jgi:hypothetical protein
MPVLPSPLASAPKPDRAFDLPTRLSINSLLRHLRGCGVSSRVDAKG